MQVEQIPTSQLVPYARNSRTHSDEQVAQIMASIREFGFCNPVLIDGDNGIIAGHGRVMAASRMKLDAVPCVRLSHLSESQKRAYVIADNKIAMNAGWNEEMLALEITELANQIDINLLGFSEGELLGIQDNEESTVDASPRFDEAEDLAEYWETARGQIWLLGDHRLMCGDSTSITDVARLLSGSAPQIMVTDPPYGVEYDPSWRNKAGVCDTKRTGIVLNDDKADWTEAWRLFPGVVAYVWHGGLHSATVHKSLIEAGFQVRAQIVWAKPRLVLSRGHYHWQHEPCWVADKSEMMTDDQVEESWYAVRKNATAGYIGGRKQSTIWEIETNEEVTTVHGTQKPIECMARPIRNHSVSAEGVYEPFCGSGTTLMACEQLHKKCFAMELSHKFVAVILQRYTDATGKSPIMISGAQSG